MTEMAVPMSAESYRFPIDKRVCSSPAASAAPPRGVLRRLRLRIADALARGRDRQRLSRLGFDARQDLGWHRVEAELRKRPWQA